MTEKPQDTSPQQENTMQEKVAEPEPQQADEQSQQQLQEEKTYLKAMPLRDLADLEQIKNEVSNGNILILKITPLANKSIVDVTRAINELYAFTEEIGGDIARLGEERVVICPPKIRIWREKKPAEKVSTAA
jgi:uncharacterized protein